MSADRFAFLSPSAVSPTGDLQPLLRTPMERGHVAAGASLVDADGGWRIADYGDGASATWVADVSHTGKVDVRGPAAELDAALGGAPGTASQEDGAWRLRITPTRGLVLCAASRVGDVAERFPRSVDMTCGLAAVLIGGEQVRELFSRVSGLDVRAKAFPAGACMAGSVARCPAVVLHEPGADDAPRFRILVGWELGEYLWETVLDAGAPLGVSPASARVALPEEVAAR
jgi:glycine cleavage system aminomethyltransferase T